MKNIHFRDKLPEVLVAEGTGKSTRANCVEGRAP